MSRALAAALAVVQAVAAIRTIARMAATANGVRIERTAAPGFDGVHATVIVPVLDEERRLEPVLRALTGEGPALERILVVDGGSRDRTAEIAARFALLDPRVHYISAAPVAEGWNGKAWGLQCGLDRSDAACAWILTIDADVRPASGFVDAFLAHARRTGDDAFSVATTQELAGPLDAVVHPALLTTLVYRFGLPGVRAKTTASVQANGQCFLARRDALVRSRAFDAARASRSEDITAARTLVANGYAVGFYESDGLITVRMHDDWRSLVANWPRSLATRDRYVGTSGVVGLIDMLFVQALPLPLVAALTISRSRHRALRSLNAALAFVRIATLIGTRRAYRHPSSTYWLSPLADLPAVALIVASALRRTVRWRGRTLVPEHA